MKLSDMYPSKFLKAEDLNGDVRVTIAGVSIEEMGEEKSKKPVLAFRGTDKQLALNKTNALVIAALYGEDSDDWTGEEIVLYATRVPFRGELVDAIRVKDTSLAAVGSISATASPTAAAKSDLPF